MNLFAYFIATFMASFQFITKAYDNQNLYYSFHITIIKVALFYCYSTINVIIVVIIIVNGKNV